MKVLIIWILTWKTHSHDEICSPVSSRRPQPSCALGGPPSSLGTKPVEGLVLNQSTWVKSESNLRLMSSVLGTAEHFMAAAGSLLKDKGDEPYSLNGRGSRGMIKTNKIRIH